MLYGDAMKKISIATTLLFLSATAFCGGIKVVPKTGGSIGTIVSGGTAGRVPYINSSGNLADDADFTFDGTSTLSATTVIGSLNVETVGTTITTLEKYQFIAGGCNNVTASSMLDLPTSNAPAAGCRTGTNFQKGTLDFDSATDESAFFGFRVPSDWTSTVDVAFLWSSTTTETNSAVWGVQMGCVADNETDDPALNTASTVTDAYGGTSASKVMIASVTGITTTGCAANEYAHVRVYRDADNGSDNLTGDARLIAVEMTMRRAQ